ncbi:MAG: ATP-binding protein, partial [Pseudomonadales bacterium]
MSWNRVSGMIHDMTRSAQRSRKQADASTGKLRIGDDWNAITIIALSQSNPLKALAEFVENSIDAGAKNIIITRGKEKGQSFISVSDDGNGIPRNKEGIPDFHYVATHICDSMKKRVKEEGNHKIQGEFGIGLLSFWTLGEELALTCAADDGQTWQMRMRKGDTDYSVNKRRVLFSTSGTELKIKPLLSGTRQLNGHKMQRYLASELRDRIRKNHINLRILDRTARKEFKVEPRNFDGRLLHQLPEIKTAEGEIYVELYLNDPDATRKVGLYRNGTRVFEDISEVEELKQSVWGSGYIEGIVDIPFINLTPGTRLGIIHDDRFMRAWFGLRQIEVELERVIEDLKKAEDEQASQQVLKSIKKAFREALLALPAEEYDWFDIQALDNSRSRKKPGGEESAGDNDSEKAHDENAGEPVPDVDRHQSVDANNDTDTSSQTAFFDFPGPLYSVRISPASSILKVGQSRTLRALPRDRGGRTVDADLSFTWQVLEGNITIQDPTAEIVTVHAGREPGLAKVKVLVSQRDTTCEAEALIT